MFKTIESLNNCCENSLTDCINVLCRKVDCRLRSESVNWLILIDSCQFNQNKFLSLVIPAVKAPCACMEKNWISLFKKLIF